MLPEVQFDQFDTPLNEDDIVNQVIPFSAFYNSSAGFSAQFLLINDIASY